MCVMPRKLKSRKPRVLRRKNVKRNRGARAQSKQIMALSRQVQSIRKKQFAKVHTVWQRNMLSVESLTGGVQSYICPIPYVPCNPDGANQPGGQVAWTDNLGLSTGFEKKAVFGVAREAATSNEIYHTGGMIKWQIVTNEPTFSKYSLFLIRPKKGMADQLVESRQLKQGTALNPTAGFAAFLQEDLDYIVHSEDITTATTSFGAQINSKYWSVLYKRDVTLGVNNVTPGTTGYQNNFNAPGDFGTTGLTAHGSIKIPAGGMVKNSAVLTQSGAGNASQATAWEVSYADQENDSGLYLVCINNGIGLDNETAKLGFLVHDYYKACV